MDTLITMLRGAARVRMRPTVFFGSNDARGAKEAVKMLLSVMMQEAMSGHADCVTVTHDRDGALSVQDNGRGIFLGEDDTIWHSLFCELYAGYPDPSKARSVWEPPTAGKEEPAEGYDLCAVQYVSRYMDVCVVRDGFRSTLRFEKGDNTGGLRREPCTDHSGTMIRFQLDETVFSDTTIDIAWLAEQLRATVCQRPSVKVVLRTERSDGFAESVLTNFDNTETP